MSTAIATDSERTGATTTATQGAGGGAGTILSGRDAINAAERVLCGAGAVADPARAEGLGLAGLSAASLLGGREAAAAAAPYVAHRRRMSPPVPAFGAFELVAESIQQGVDHCVVAHRLVSALGGAGACVLPGALPSEVAFVRLPGPDAACAEGTAGGTDDAVAGAFGAATRALGRPCRPFSALHVDGADHVIVAAGPAASVARRLVDLLRGRGVSCGALSVALVRPMVPSLQELLRARSSVIVISDEADEAGSLLAHVRRALAHGGPAVVGVPFAAGGESELVARVAAALGAEINGDANGLRLGPPPMPARSLLAGVAPASRWSDELLRGALSWVGERVSVAQPAQGGLGVSVLSVARAGLRPGALEATAGLDVLFVAHPRLVSPVLVARLRKGGVLLVQSGAADSDALWAELGPARARAITEQGVSLQWVDAAQCAPAGDPVCDPRVFLQGAILGAFEALESVLPPSQGGRVPQGAGAALLGLGAGAIRRASNPPASLSPRAQTGTPRVQGGPDTVDLAWRDAIRHFHVTGEGGWTGADPLPSLPLMPLRLTGLLASAPRDLPLVLTGQATGPIALPLARVIASAVESYEASGSPSLAVGPRVERLLRVAARALGSGAPQALASVMGAALDAFVAEFQVSDKAAQALGAEVAHVKRSLPEGSAAVGLGRHAVLALHSAATSRARTGAVATVTAEVRELCRKLQDLLRVDDAKAPAARSADALSASVGAGAKDLFDATALAASLQTRRGATILSPSRRAHIEATIGELTSWLGGRRANPVVLHSGLLDGVALADMDVVAHPDPLEAAIGVFDGLSGKVAALLRAVRRARLEVAGAYDPALHDAPIARLGWESFTADELRLVPPVIVVQDASAVRQALASFAGLLRSGRTVQVIALEGAMGGEPSPDRFGLGYLAVAHRDVFVLQGTLARPLHLAEGLCRMARATRPSVALVAEPAWGSAAPESVQLEAALQGRGTPCFIHDPAAGPTWAERFDLSENPAPEAPWVTAGADVIGLDGAPTRVEGPFTFAHAAALDPDARLHVRLIPPAAWSDEQVEVAEWLAGDAGTPRVPFVEVVDEAGQVCRAVISRELAWAARDRAQFWRVLQELAGTNNEYAERAATAARARAIEEAEERLAAAAAQHASQLDQARAETAREALEKVARVLLDLDLAAPATARAVVTAPPALAAPPSAAAEAVAPAPVVESAAEADASFDEAYLDTPLCTTCNECINLNPRMFKYNADKQALLADVTAGTFAQLVAAAEKCSARCIHPGKPRKGDASATPDVLARAAAL